MPGKIDMHAHCRIEYRPEYGWSGKLPLPEELCALYDEKGVDMGVLLPLVSPEYCTLPVTNEEIAAIVRAYPERFLWFCGIDPRWGDNAPGDSLRPILSRYKAMGARGVGEMTANLPFGDPRVRSLFRVCEELGMPVLFHVGDAMGDYGLIDEMGLSGLESALREFPALPLIGHSQKFWSEIGGDVTAETRGGYPTGPVTPGGRVPELLDRYPNLYGDLSAGSGANAVFRDPEFAYGFLETYQDRLVFGMDICSANVASAPVNPLWLLSGWLDEAVAAQRISRTAYEKISRENAARLLHI